MSNKKRRKKNLKNKHLRKLHQTKNIKKKNVNHLKCRNFRDVPIDNNHFLSYHISHLHPHPLGILLKKDVKKGWQMMIRSHSVEGTASRTDERYLFARLHNNQSRFVCSKFPLSKTSSFINLI
jgi:hypothetical protein